MPERLCSLDKRQWLFIRKRHDGRMGANVETRPSASSTSRRFSNGIALLMKSRRGIFLLSIAIVALVSIWYLSYEFRRKPAVPVSHGSDDISGARAGDQSTASIDRPAHSPHDMKTDSMPSVPTENAKFVTPRSGSDAEALVLSAEGIRGDAADAVLQSARYSDYLRKLRSDSAGSQLAIDNSRRYGDQIGKLLAKKFSGSEIEELACAETICGMEVIGDNSYVDGLFQGILNSGSPDAPFYSVVTREIQLPDGRVSYRMIFSTDPARNAINVPSAPPKS